MSPYPCSMVSSLDSVSIESSTRNEEYSQSSPCGSSASLNSDSLKSGSHTNVQVGGKVCVHVSSLPAQSPTSCLPPLLPAHYFLYTTITSCSLPPRLPHFPIITISCPPLTSHMYPTSCSILPVSLILPLRMLRSPFSQFRRPP